MLKRPKSHFFVSLVFLLSACVQTTTGGFQPEVSEEQAVVDYSRSALAYLEAGELVAARRHANNALAINGQASASLGVLALISQQEGDKELAEAYFRQALRANPDASRVRNNYAVFLFDAARYELAFEQLARVVSDPTYLERSRAYENLGLTALRLGRSDEAEAAFERALQLSSAMMQSALELGILSIERQEWAQARVRFEGYLTAREAAGESETSDHSERALTAGLALAREAGDELAARVWQRTLESLYPSTGSGRD